MSATTVERRVRLGLGASVVISSLLVAVLVAGPSAGAAPALTVNSTLDEHLAGGGGGGCVSTPSGVCTLRAAIEEINGTTGGGTITVPAGTYVLGLGSMLITGAATISGAGAGTTIIDGRGVDRVFEVETTGAAYIADMTVQHGMGTAGLAGHGHGGCLHNHGQLTLVNSTVRDCIAQGSWAGGGIASSATATLKLVNDTITNSISADGWGGGVLTSGTSTLDNVTIANNLGLFGGSGISGSQPMRINNTILADNAFENCFSAGITEAAGSGNNLNSRGGCLETAAGDLHDTDPLLGTLRSDGTLPLLAGSPAIDAGDSSPSNCPSTDERGLVRPQDGRGSGTALCDIGAYEAPAPPNSTATGGGGAQAPSGATTAVTPTQRPAGSGVSCSPNPFAAGESTVCKATISDNDAGAKTTPTGTVAFTSGSAGRFGSHGTCTLRRAKVGVASCTLRYTSLSPGSQTIAANYGGDSAHAARRNGTMVTVAVPASTAGCSVDGHGRITATNGNRGSFLAHAKANRPRGQLSYRDSGPVRATRMAVLSVDAVNCSAHASWARIFGKAKVNGTGSFEYRIDVQRAGGRRRNGSYRIRLSSGYDSGVQPIRQGGMQIRTQASRSINASSASLGGAVSPRGGSPGQGMAAGDVHTCVLLSSGGVECWGGNGYGQLGNASINDSSAPVAVSGITTATAIAAGAFDTCALLASGGVDCWGNNDDGQLGNGSTANSSTPVAVSGITTATAIAADYNHTCALLASGGIDCWGDNGLGQLGDGTASGPACEGVCSLTPVAVSGITTATAIAAGDSHTCALLASGGIDCWGSNGYGELGDGSTINESATPVAVSGITTATAIAAGVRHTCALIAGGGVDCWGDGALGQLGNGGTANSSTPAAVSGVATATAITAGVYHTCAVLTGGGVACWGFNGLGQLGNGSTADSSTPAGVSGMASATAIAGGGFHTCAILAGGGIDCWGWNGFGQFGNGTTTSRSTPVPVTGFP